MKKTIRALTAVLAFVALASLLITVCYAHSGRTDSKGGHYDRKNGGYHYHHGYPAHDHPDGKCPYKSYAEETTNAYNYFFGENIDSDTDCASAEETSTVPDETSNYSPSIDYELKTLPTFDTVISNDELERIKNRTTTATHSTQNESETSGSDSSAIVAIILIQVFFALLVILAVFGAKSRGNNNPKD